MTAPWQLAASDRPADQAMLDALLVQYLVSARTIAAALAPIVPSLSARLLDVARRSGCVGPTGAAARALAPALSSAALFGRARRDR